MPHTSRRNGQAEGRPSIYDEITDAIIADLDAGCVPWAQPWASANAPLDMPHNAASRRRYSGINVVILWAAAVERGFSTNAFLTFRQARELGGTVRKGERGTTVVYAHQFVPREERARAEAEQREPGSIPLLKRFTVFNTDQCDGLPDAIGKPPAPVPDHLILPRAEALISATGADFRIGGDKAYFSPTHDYVQVPRPDSFFDPINWHRTAFHELSHWTGHSSRLGRDQSGAFGSAAYGQEELVAEIGAAFVCATLGITPTVRHADYIGSWLAIMREDNRAILRAASAASRRPTSWRVISLPAAGPEGEEGLSLRDGLESRERESRGGPSWRIAVAKAPQKIALSRSCDIPFNKLVLSQANVRKIKTGVSVAELAEDIARRTLLQSLNVRPVLDADGRETGQFEVPAGGRRYRALEMLVTQKRLAKDAPIPCIVRAPGDDISAEEDSLAENAFREPLHPLDQFRAMQVLAQQGDDVDAIAAHFMTSTTVVRQRLKLASVSPRLHAIYADDGMTLEQLMAFSVCDDHQRQEQVWDLLAHSYNRSPSYIRSKLTEDTARASDKRARFVTVDAYIAAGGGVMRDLFEEDRGGWLTDPALLDRLVAEKLAAEDEKVHAEGWKWVSTAVDLPWGVTHGLRAIEGTPVPMSVEEAATLEALQRELEGLEREWADASEVPDDINARLNAIGEAIAGLSERPMIFEPGEMARAGAFVSIDADGSLRIERGYVRPEDEAAAGADSASGADIIAAAPPREGDEDRPDPQPGGGATDPGLGEEEAEGEATKPLPERLVAELTAWRTLALQDALAQRPAIAFAMVLHALVLRTFYRASCESCVELTLHPVSFAHAPADLRDSAPARAMAERHALWTDRLPKSDRDLWVAILELDSSGQGALFAHCASQAVNAQQEIVPKYDNGRDRHLVTAQRRRGHAS
ncbi:MAG: zincin-like metallopeptidase domain-containing protein [Sphingomonas sp.]